MVAPADVLVGRRILLASSSPRRAELLRAAGFSFEVRPSDVDESLIPGEAPDAYVIRLAKSKALAVADADGQIILAADTAVVVDAHILGKPTSVDDASRMLTLLSGRTHHVLTAVAVRHLGKRVDARLETTAVEFDVLTSAELDWYVASGEPMDKAGAYAIQGLASRFVRRIVGSYTNVVGLPIALVYQMLLADG